MYVFGKTTGEKKPAPMADTEAVKDVETFDIEAYIGSLTDTLSNDSLRAAITTTLAELKGISASREQQKLAPLNKQLRLLFTEARKPLAVAWFARQEAVSQNEFQALMDAGDYNSMLLQSAPDEKVQRFLSDNATTCFHKAAELDTANVTAKLRLASSYMVAGTDPMKGVFMLREVLAKDSNNIEALLLMGKFSLLSGQMDKALLRYEKVLSLRPFQTEALLGMAQICETQGDKSGAIGYLEKSLKTDVDGEMKREIRKHLEELKQTTK